MRLDQVIDELNTELLKNLPTRDVPLQYYVRDNLPLSGVGKIDYRTLIQKAEKEKAYRKLEQAQT